ncbi:Outer membrane protein N, non-specific porin [Vibrio chagasii]|uniref:porin n=1 Tax=Vibrio TaxID=662 RepID=UPI000E3283EC|nr:MULTISPECIES: porin [Vibrio]CAH6781466.1 Outer membrane protein N, non-specific porin [Vibrio chagasii]CAH6800047.1 Outer membrane protein N, non-specific porin [Vibrio chagasii]CAH6829775.1 Outer membrane protein N, non-specific porin [Vibrio chagasii]CAH6984048.1 Outer membrane protein N, non-specific porin [Vibrio chagasii]CAH6984965.1 Outer membrane protein N, non-specific porin [Vibrio chagasii]
MKKAVLASAVVAALVSGSSLAATVYSSDGTELKIGGRAEFRGDFIGSGGAEVEGTMEDKTRFRLNLGGKTELTDTVTAFGFYEAEQSTGDSEFDNRYMYAGVDFDGQAVSVGRQDMASVIVSDFTDITEFSGVQQVIDAASDKEDSVFAYRGGFDALQLEATYQANSAKDTDGYGISGVYSLPIGLDLGLAYSGQDLGAGNGSANQILAGLAYSLDNLYLAATYSTGDLNDKAVGPIAESFTAMEFAAQYKITKQVSAAAVYTYQENEAANGSTADSVDGIELVGYYKLNSNFRTYLSYYINGLDEVKNVTTGLTTEGEDTLRLGVRYDF